ncbi:glycosyltransferase family 61 protein [uncultured Tateyamaria sp.]|uniref:glycosyltransferase family 61 protein n=1 Tax=uncultured Tateyamaria sp. TaxID=455651 RepID=UPI002613CE3F|nr:glycosyltransferase family 61 protein [uncultured Tateyamaria sp.]
MILPLTDDLPDPRIRVVRGAVVVPDQGADLVPHGVFDSRGAFLPLSRARLSRGRVSAVPEARAVEDHLPGTHLYMGFSHTHFGHFLLEGIARLWALDHAEMRIDGLVLPARCDMDMEHNLSHNLGPVVARLCDGLPVRIMHVPTRVDRLVLPSAGFGHGPWLAGTPAFRAFVAKRFAQIEVDGPERLYLTRGRLNRPDQLVDREDEIEAMMEAAGYFVFAPEKFHFEVQLGVFRAARQIVGPDGSAFHHLPFAMRRDAQAAVFMRRNRPEVLGYLARQMEGFAGVTPTTIDPRVRPLPRTTPAPLDLDVLRDRLADAGFL